MPHGNDRAVAREQQGLAAEPEAAASGSASREIEVERVCKRFDDQVVLKDISFEVDAGELLVIVGESGCGKSILLDIITGMLKPESGRVLVIDHNQDDAPLIDMLTLSENERDAIRQHWGEVFQRNALYSGTVYENIALWFRAHTELGEDEIRERIRTSLIAANLDVDDVIDKPRESLSGGMAKRVAIARAIAIDPAVLFYDEPTSGLDPVTSASIHDLIWNMHQGAGGQRGMRTSIVITHDKELLRRLAPRVLMLHDGGVQFDGSFDDFEHSKNEVAKRYLAKMPVLHEDTSRAQAGRATRQ